MCHARRILVTEDADCATYKPSFERENDDNIMFEAGMEGFSQKIDGVKVYASGDTSKTKQMEEFADLKIDYALFPGDGLFNMGPDEAAECARIVGARHNILIHLKPGQSIRKTGEAWGAPDKLIIEPGEEIALG